ncbi:hypothetical protein Agub_g8347 [Astrephomene gubernaculifera]|uniref:Uncharacterized protein n=1 Tax=Astrephomene gubernaculifera TaxID=47775 RepID=A0AAD3DRI0_9CHLO|nr:hypothetical protein Agub_g8347 [Astrephomene gubernaculifera]
MTQPKHKPLVPITREYLRLFYQKYPLEPVPAETRETHMRNVELLAGVVTKPASCVPEQYGLATPTRIDDCFWRNRMICEEIALSLSKLTEAFPDTPDLAIVCERCRELLVKSERAVFAVQESNTASVKAQLQQFIPQDFRGALLESKRLSTEARYRRQIEDLVKRGGSIRQKFDTYLQQQWERRQALVQLGECSGMFKMVIKWVAGIPQVLLDFAKEINAKLGPMEEQRIKYGPDLYGITTLGLRLDVCLAAWAENAEAPAARSAATQLVEVVEPAIQFYCEHMLRVIQFIGDVFQHSPFFVSKEDIEGHGAGDGEGGDEVVSVRVSSSTAEAVAAVAAAAAGAVPAESGVAAAKGGGKKGGDYAAPSLTLSACSSDVGSMGAAGAGVHAVACTVTAPAASAAPSLAPKLTPSPVPVAPVTATAPAAASPSAAPEAASSPAASAAQTDHNAVMPAAASSTPSTSVSLALPPRQPSLVHMDTPPPHLLTLATLSGGRSHSHSSQGHGHGHVHAGHVHMATGSAVGSSRAHRGSHVIGRSSWTADSMASYVTAEEEQPWYCCLEEGFGSGGSEAGIDAEQQRQQQQPQVEQAEQQAQKEPQPQQLQQTTQPKARPQQTQTQPLAEQQQPLSTSVTQQQQQEEAKGLTTPASKGRHDSNAGGCFSCFWRGRRARPQDHPGQPQQQVGAAYMGPPASQSPPAPPSSPSAVPHASSPDGNSAPLGHHGPQSGGDGVPLEHLNPIAE